MKFNLLLTLFLWMLFAACKVTLITGYDQVLDETLTKMKKDFNLHFIRLSRALQDKDPNNQKFENFLEYYDNLAVDTLTIFDRVQTLGPKSNIVKTQVGNVNKAFRQLIEVHQNGLRDDAQDSRKDIQSAINSTINAVIRLQEALKANGKLK